MDLQRHLRLALETGDVTLGFKETLKIIRAGKTKLLVVASNPSKEVENLAKEAKDKGVYIYNFNNSSIDLGTICGRRHPVSILAIIKQGDSEILNLIKGD
jgi:large subunit ribosomal protein L30e